MSTSFKITTKTKPCPFCGGTKLLLHTTSSYDWSYIECEGCGACSPDNQEKHIDNELEVLEAHTIKLWELRFDEKKDG